MSVFEYVWAGVMAVFAGPEAFAIFGVGISITLLMVAFGFFLGAVSLVRFRTELLRREQRRPWVQQLIQRHIQTKG